MTTPAGNFHLSTVLVVSVRDAPAKLTFAPEVLMSSTQSDTEPSPRTIERLLAMTSLMRISDWPNAARVNAMSAQKAATKRPLWIVIGKNIGARSDFSNETEPPIVSNSQLGPYYL